MRQLIKTDGTVVDLPQPVTIAEIEALIGADYLDTVSLRHMGEPLHVMMVDDLGHKRGLPENPKATALYLKNCIPGTTHVIVGDVVIVPDDDPTNKE